MTDFEHPFDRLLRVELSRLYKQVLDEPLPPELADLARQLEAKIGTSEDGDKSGSGD